ncbi:MAG: RNA polymerase sigma factor [Vicinamibacterales bacterium]
MDRETELALVGGLREGDTDAFDEAYGWLSTPVFTFLLRLSRRHDVAEDLAEETWLRLVTHAGRLRPDTRLAPWLYTVARHLYLSYRRSRFLEDSAAVGLMTLWPYNTARSSPFEETAASELERRLERALATLPVATREVLLLVGVAGLDPSDAADVCGVTPETLRQRLHRAREALAKALDREAALHGPVREGTLSCQTR